MPMVATAVRGRLGVEVLIQDPDLAVAKGAAVHAMALTGMGKRLLGSGVNDRPAATLRLLAAQPVASVLPRALGIKLHDSFAESGTREFIHHLVEGNTALPIAGVRAAFSTIMNDQEKIRVELFEQAGVVASDDIAHNRRVLDGELSGLPPLPAGSPIDFELVVGLDGRITCTATEPTSGATLVLESYIDGVVDAGTVIDQRSHVTALRLRN